MVAGSLLPDCATGQCGWRSRATQDYLQRSGYGDLNRPIVLTTAFSEGAASGHAFAPRRIVDVVPGRVYALSGFEFTEYYFVVSDDGRELIGIDAGTRPDSAKAAYEALRAHAPRAAGTDNDLHHALALGSRWRPRLFPFP